MTDTTSPFTYAREHAAKSWQMFAREKGLTATVPDWQEDTAPDGTPLLSGQVTGRRAVWALERFARDFHVTLHHPGDLCPQFDITQPGRTVLVWRAHLHPQPTQGDPRRMSTTLNVETPPTTARPVDYLRGMAYSMCHAIRLTKEGDEGEAGEHVDAIERLIAAYRTAVSEAA